MCCLTLYPCISHLKYGGIFGDDCISDLLWSLASKDFRKWFSIWQGQEGRNIMTPFLTSNGPVPCANLYVYVNCGWGLKGHPTNFLKCSGKSDHLVGMQNHRTRSRELQDSGKEVFLVLMPKTLVSSVFCRLSVTFSSFVLVLYQFWLKLTRHGSFTPLKVSWITSTFVNIIIVSYLMSEAIIVLLFLRKTFQTVKSTTVPVLFCITSPCVFIES